MIVLEGHMVFTLFVGVGIIFILDINSIMHEVISKEFAQKNHHIKMCCVQKSFHLLKFKGCVYFAFPSKIKDIFSEFPT